jgi:hypothetical protein
MIVCKAWPDPRFKACAAIVAALNATHALTHQDHDTQPAAHRRQRQPGPLRHRPPRLAHAPPVRALRRALAPGAARRHRRAPRRGPASARARRRPLDPRGLHAAGRARTVDGARRSPRATGWSTSSLPPTSSWSACPCTTSACRRSSRPGSTTSCAWAAPSASTARAARCRTGRCWPMRASAWCCWARAATTATTRAGASRT